MTPQYSTITTSNLSSTISLETYQSHTATTTYTTATIASDLITPSSSCASENILTVIESPFNDVPRVNMATSPAPDTHDGLQIGNYLKDCLNKDTCTECNSDKSQDESGDKCKIKEVEPSKQKVIEKCNKQLNPKKSPEMTVKKSQNKDDGVKQKPKTISSHSKKTDDIRTKRTSQAVQKQVPTKINHALDSKSENNEFKCANGEEPNLKNVESKAKLMERNVWQIGEIKEPTVELNDDLPIDTSEIIQSEIDTTSFVIIPAPSNISEISANPTITKDTTADQQFTTPTKDRDKCTDCCFCNPQLHKMPEGPTSERSNCSFCKTARRLPDAVPTPDQFYQTMSKSDHTHIKTRSRDSDTVSVKCTKVNQKIRRLVSGGDKELSKSFDEKMEMKRENSRPNLTRPKNVNKIPTSKLDEPDDEAKIKTTKQTQQLPRIPSPYTILSSDKYDGTSSPCSSTSSCPASPKKGIAVLPVSRWQNQPPRQLSRRRPTRSQEHPVLDQKQNVENGNNGSKAGWSVTVAGNYHQDMAPDVEMRLCFPKSSQQHTSSHNEDAMQFKREFRHPNVSAFRQHLDDDLDVASARPIRALPPTQLHINPKKNLNRTVPDRSQTSSRRYNFPEVSTTSHIVTSRQTAKKAIKRVECSVAVTSATTKSFSNITRGQRAMSFQALNNSDHYKLSKTRQRDHSIDLGNLSSRRMSIESQTPSEAMTLTVMGNAIAPERKPRVPTQSERDVTRRHSSCFTRNRSVLS